MAGSIPSIQDIWDVGFAVLTQRRPSMIVRSGDVSDAYLWAGAAMANMVIGSGARGFRSTLLFGAEGDDLHVVGHSRGVDWDPGDKAVVPLLFSRLSMGVAGTIPAGTRVGGAPDPVTGSFPTFTVDTDVIFQSSDLSKLNSGTCTVVDKIGNVDINSVNRILDTIPLSGITVTNPEIGAGGSPPESDQDYKSRVASFPLTLRRGTEDALIFGAKLTPGVRRASVTLSGSGVVFLYVSDADGNSNSVLANAAQRIIDGPPAWRGAGDNVMCVASSLLTQNVDYSLTVRAGVDVNALFGRTDIAISVGMSRLQPGETLFRDLISTAVKNVDSRSIVSCRVNTPAADIVPSQSQIIRAGVISHS